MYSSIAINLMQLTQSGSSLILLSLRCSIIPFLIALLISVELFGPIRHCKRTSTLYVNSSYTTYRERQTLTGIWAVIMMPTTAIMNRAMGMPNKKLDRETHAQLQWRCRHVRKLMILVVTNVSKNSVVLLIALSWTQRSHDADSVARACCGLGSKRKLHLITYKNGFRS